MKKIYQSLFVFLVLLSCGAANAATTYKSVQLNYKDNTSVRVAFEENMTTTLEGDQLVMECDKGHIYSPLSDLKSIGFSSLEGTDKEWAGIDELLAETEGMLVLVANGEINVMNVAPGTQVNVYNIAGQAVRSTATDGSGSVKLGGLAKGVYVVTVNNKSIKIALK